METKIGQCHCGAVAFKVTLENGLQNLRRCNCSLCRRKGAIMATVPLDKLELIKGQDHLRLHQWHTMTAEHYFCDTCGIYTHHRRRSVPTEYGFNVACLDDVDPFAFENIVVGNGAAQ